MQIHNSQIVKYDFDAFDPVRFDAWNKAEAKKAVQRLYNEIDEAVEKGFCTYENWEDYFYDQPSDERE